MAATYGQFAIAAATVVATAEAGGRTRAAASCVTGRWTESVFGAGSGLGSRLSDPDEALNFVRHRPGATSDELTAFIDGFAGNPGPDCAFD